MNSSAEKRHGLDPRASRRAVLGRGNPSSGTSRRARRGPGAGCSRSRPDGCSGIGRRARPRVRRRVAWRRPPTPSGAAARDGPRRRPGRRVPARSPWKASLPRHVERASRSRNSRRNRRERTRTGRKKPGRQGIQREPSGASPPPGTTMCTCGWWVSAEPQVWSTAVSPIRAPRCFGSAAMVRRVSAAVRNSRS